MAINDVRGVHAAQQSKIVDGHRSEGHAREGGSDPFDDGSLPPFMRFCPRTGFRVLISHPLGGTDFASRRCRKPSRKPQGEPFSENFALSAMVSQCLYISIATISTKLLKEKVLRQFARFRAGGL